MASQNLESERTLRAFLPSKMEMISLPLISLAFLTAANSFQWLRTVDGRNYMLVIEYMQLRVRGVLSYLDSVLGATAPLLIFWMFIGLIVYVLLWAAIGAWKSYQEDLPADGKRMIVPKGYNHARVLRGSIVHIFVRILATAMLIVWIYQIFARILPYASSLFLRGFETISFQTAAYCLLAILIVAASAFVTSILSRCTVLRDRVFRA